MEKIDRIFGSGSKYQRLSGPLTAAAVCEAARAAAKGRFAVLSFREGLLTAGTKNSGEAANLQLENDQIIREINKELGKELVKRIRFKII